MFAYRPRSAAVQIPSSTCNHPYQKLHYSSHDPLPVHTEDLLASTAGHFTLRHQQQNLEPPMQHTSILSSRTTSSLPQPNSTGMDLADFAALLFIILWYIKPALGSSLFPTRIANTSTKNILFQSVLRPASSFQQFCRKVMETTKLSLPSVLIGLEFLNRLKDRTRGITTFIDASPPKLMTVVLMLADKFVTDNTFTVATWAKVTGIPREQLVKLEFQVLKLLDYNIFISKEGYEGWIERLQKFTDEYNTLSSRIMGIVRAQQFRRKNMEYLEHSAEGNLHLDHQKKANPRIAKGSNVNRCNSLSLLKRHMTNPATFNQQVATDKIWQLPHVLRACQSLPFIVGAPLPPLSDILLDPLNAGNQKDVPMESTTNSNFSSQVFMPSIPPSAQGNIEGHNTGTSSEEAVGCIFPFTPPDFQDRTFPDTLPHASRVGRIPNDTRYDLPLTPTPSSLDPSPFHIPQIYRQQTHIPYFAGRNQYSTLAV